MGFPCRKVYEKNNNLLVVFCCSLSNAQTPMVDNNSHIIKHKYYWINFNDSARQANYVFYKLYKTHLTTTQVVRKNSFTKDPLCINSMSPIEYKGKKLFEKGHLFNFEDNAWDNTCTASKECFYMTNIGVQYSNFNRGLWKELENYERTLTIQNDSIYSTTGLVFDKITAFAVPFYFFKIIYYFKENKWQNECYLMQNKIYSIRQNIQDFKTTQQNIIYLLKGKLKY